MQSDIEFRRAPVEADEKRGVLVGRAVPYADTIELSPGVFERFDVGAFSKQANARDHYGRVKLLYGHDHTQVPLGRAVALEERADGLWAEYQVNTALIAEPGLARNVWLSILEGDLTDLSVGFRPIKTKTERGEDGVTLVRRAAHLVETSVVPFGAYGEAAQLASVRSQIAEDEAWHASWAARLSKFRAV